MKIPEIRKRQIRGLVINTAISGLGIYAVIFKSSIALNLFTAVTFFAVFLIAIVIMAISLMPEKPEIQSLFSAILAEHPSSIKIWEKCCDISLIIVLFGFAHWWKAMLWFVIHFVASTYVKEVAKISLQEENA